MRYRNNLTFKLFSVSLIAFHLFVFCLRDAAVVFAEEATATESDGVGAAGPVAPTSAIQAEENVPASTEESGKETTTTQSAQAMSSTSYSLTQNNSTGFNLNALQNVNPSLFSGALTYSVPIAVPPGRKGIQPNISLAYSSQSGNGILGTGWSLDLGSIERSTKNGVPKYNSQDTFIFKSGGSTVELVNIGGNEYRAKTEEAFMKFTFDGYSWTVKDKSGITYYFGQTVSSQQNNGSNVFKWCLDKIKDTLGNYMILTYIKADGQIYPDTINYTGFDGSPSLSSAFQVDFDYVDSRSDYFFSYRSNFLVKTNKLLSAITVNQNGSRIRKYDLSYQQSSSTKKALLTSVNQFGLTDASSLPPISFTYQIKPFSFSNVVSWGNIHDFGSGDSDWKGTVYANYPYTSVDIFDINRDGLPDRIFRGYNSQDYTRLWVQLNNGSSFDNLTAWSNIAAQAGDNNRASIRYAYSHCYMSTIDINGDTLPDRIHTNYNGYNQWEVEVNNGNGFNSSIAWTNIYGFHDPGDYTMIWGYNYSPEVWGLKDLFDINGDGKPDRVIGGGSDRWYVQLNTGNSSFTNSTEWLNAQYDTHISESYIRHRGPDVYFTTFDLNGDGLADHLMNHDGGDWEVQFNNGKAFESMQMWGPVLVSDRAWQFFWCGAPMFVGSYDINGDGLVDRVMRNYNDIFGPWMVQINNGHGFEPISYWTNIIQNGNSDRAHIRAGSSAINVDFFDINGDGLPDRIMTDLSDTTDHWDVQLNNGPMPDLLATVSNGIGGQAQFTYDTYIGNDNTELADKGNLGFPVSVITQITSSDGRGSTYLTGYYYDKGKFDYIEREFSGFGKVRVTDAEGNYSVSYFLQDKYNKGRPYKQESYNSLGTIQAKSENTWVAQDNVYPGYSDVKFIYLSESNSFTYNNGTATKRTKTGYVYGETPQYGNPTQIVEYGEVDVNTGSDIANDKRTTFIEYNYNNSPNYWIVSLPARTYSQDINSNKVSEKKFYYDDNLGIFNTPLQGLLTKEEVWLYNPVTSIQDQVSSIYDYDNFGNLVSATDANNHATTTIYDTTYRIFPLTIRNHLGHTVASQYYGVNGVPLNDGAGFKGLFGQVKSTRDPNGVSSNNTYDDLGRLEKAIGPNDSISYPAVINEYDLDVTNPLTDPIKITKKVKAVNSPSSTNYPDYYIGYSFYDGLGRLIEAKSPAEPDPITGAPRQIISGITEYNSRGLVDKKYLPYFVNSSSSFVAPSFSSPYSSLQYDSLGRIIQTTNPDLISYSTASYSDWTVTSTDEEGHYKTYYYDAYQRLIQVDEHNEGQVYTTTYLYDSLGNLIEVTDHLGNTTTITYDSLGRKVRMNDPDMGIWQYEYDDVGNLKKQIDAAGQQLVFVYDEINRLTIKEIQQSQVVTYEYDNPAKNFSKGRLTKVTYQAGQTEFFYDNLGRETKSIKKVNEQGIDVDYTVLRSYDPLDRLVSLTYPDAEVVTYTYNPQGIETVTGQTGQTSKTYVANIDYSATSQIAKIVYGNGTQTNYSYDPNTLRLNQLQTTNNQLQTLQDMQYSFDSVGNILGITDNVNSAQQSFLYDHLNRLTSANGTYYGQVNYSYDATGNILTKGSLSLNYNDLRPHAVSSYADSSTGHTVNFTYDDNGNMSERVNAQTSEQTNYYYDYESHLTKVEQAYPQGSAMSITLEFEQGWNFFSLPLIPNSPSISVIFSGFAIGTDYDQISRYDPQTDTFDNYVGNPLFDEFNTLEFGKGYAIYVNNPAGMRVTVLGTAPSPQGIPLLSGWNLIPYPYLSSRSTQSALGNLQYGVDYDRVLSYNQSTGTFNEYPGSLSSLEPNKSYYLHCLRDTTWNLETLSRTTNFYYDGDGGRVKRVSLIDKANTTTYIGSLFEKVQYDNASIPTKVKKHIYAGANRVAVIETGQGDLPSSTNYYHGDHLGSSNVVTDQSGTQIARYEYQPFGSQAFESGTYSTDIKYTGKIQDDTGLYYYGARYYDPVIGRFISPDTIVQAPQDPQTLNRYAYCRNNPVKYIDPTGHSWKGFWKSLAGGVIGAVVGILSGQPWLGFSAYNAFMAVSNGGNIGAAIGGALIGYFGGMGVGGLFGNFWGTISSGAIGGASGAGIAGGDVGLAALSGFAGSLIGYAVGGMTEMAGLGTIIGGGVGSEVAGGDFFEGALGGLAYNIGFTIGSTFAPMQSTSQVADTAQSGDQVFYAGDRIGGKFSLFSIGMAILDPGPFNHTDIALGGGKVAGSHPGMGVSHDGPDVRDMKGFPAYKGEKAVRVAGKAAVGNKASALVTDMKDYSFRYLSKETVFSNSGKTNYCSQFTAQAQQGAGQTGVYGEGPNTQYWYSKK